MVLAGGYTATTGRVSYSLGQQRRVSGRLSAATGTLYDGTKPELTYTASRGRLLPAAGVVADRTG